ncbi:MULTISPECIES: signal peptidase II [unclassified Paracoccus (in: a-proteobacteria)]|uniref:signal peptidase II n=1 Tax=Paracoccus TaxID=265 RepID=UPI000CD32507|nr:MULTISPECIES: signal peptidase II [unclassified Paracoccus (in: a-proteobacteria)]MDQ1901954.1 signal peptidase II [Paracoccus sp. WLY502]
MKMVWPILIIAFGAALDLAAKLWARASLEPYGAATEFLPFVALRLTFNHGVSFSLLSFEGEAARLTVLLATAALTAAFALWAFRSEGLERIAGSFVVAGALANVIDRAVYGTVTDYLDLHFGAWHPFVFNLADVWITAGAILLFFCQFGRKQSSVAVRN